MAPVIIPPAGKTRRIDLHCHSNASTEASEAVLSAMRCPESYSTPQEIVRLAEKRGMDFVTITDHDSIAGVSTIAARENVLVGEEVSCFFPEDGCKMHVLVYGITPQDHDALQARAASVYDVAAYVHAGNLAHSVAHPLYRNNDRLERWHVERLLLLFRGFECLNGAHSALHQEAFEHLLDGLTAEEIARLAELHHLAPLYAEPWIKARTGGSDDHALLNVGRTWTEFPGHVRTLKQVLECLRTGNCSPGGQAGSGIKLAHQFLSVGLRYYGRELRDQDASPSLPSMLLQTLAGERPLPKKRQLIKLAVKHKVKGLGSKLLKPWKRKESAGGSARLLGKPFLESARGRLKEHPELLEALKEGVAPLGEHAAMFRFASGIHRDVLQSVAKFIEHSARSGEITGIFDGLSAVAAQQLLCLPYYFAFFHQAKERRLLRSLTGFGNGRAAKDLRVGMFTDTLDEVNGVGRFIRDMSEQAEVAGANLTIHTCSAQVRLDLPNRRNFQPIASWAMPRYQELPVNLPPAMEIMEWAERQQFDAIEVSTPGPMGLMGLLVARMLRIPVLATYHTDFPAYVDHLTGDHRLADATKGYMSWFYGQVDRVFTRSRDYTTALGTMGIGAEKIVSFPPGVDTEKFNARHREERIWKDLGVRQKHKLIYCGRVSKEKNLPLLEEAFRRLCGQRRDVALIVVGDGPHLADMQKSLAGVPATFLGYRFDDELSSLYASSDLCVFPSRTDTLGQVVMEAQASGIPAIVSDEGGPREMVDHGITGLVLGASDAGAWQQAIGQLLDDAPLRQRMARSAVTRIARFSLARTFETFWAQHANVALADHKEKPSCHPTDPSKSQCSPTPLTK